MASTAAARAGSLRVWPVRHHNIPLLVDQTTRAHHSANHRRLPLQNHHSGQKKNGCKWGKQSQQQRSLSARGMRDLNFLRARAREREKARERERERERGAKYEGPPSLLRTPRGRGGLRMSSRLAVPPRPSCTAPRALHPATQKVVSAITDFETTTIRLSGQRRSITLRHVLDTSSNA